jgi:hypothetical protein
MPSTHARSARFSFLAKAAAALALIALADFLFFDHGGGWTVGLFALGWTITLAATVPAVRRARPLAWLAGGALFGLVLVEDPGLLAWTLFWICLSVAALLPRLGSLDNALRVGLRLLLHWLSSSIAAWMDLFRLPRLTRGRRRHRSLRRLLSLIGLPLAGGLLFLLLFASANPLIDNAFAGLRLPAINGFRLFFWAIVLMAVWPSLRPRRLVASAWTGAPELVLELPGVSVASVTLSLILFNAIFAVQNGLDLAFLWSGAPLPEGVTLAEYAHRGAYPLIATALLAGLFVLVTMRPGSETAQSLLIRRLVLAWIAQNLLLVASSILRTIDYIDVYSLTELRIAALAWMGLVALGLVLICWRLFRGRSASWLINANAAAAAAVLAAASVVDLGAIAASWNVRHAQEVGGRGAALDLCYLNRLGSSALVSLVELERRPIHPALRDRVRWVRSETMAELSAGQGDWRQWTWRGARRLAAAQAQLGPRPLSALPTRHGRECDGSISPPPPPRIDPASIAPELPEAPAGTTAPVVPPPPALTEVPEQ